MVSELDRLLREASRLVGCDEVSLRCWSPVLEVVYAERDGAQLVITDRGETYEYLSRRADPTYDIDLLGEATAREICRECGVELDTTDSERQPEIKHVLAPSDDVTAAVAAVAQAIDRINDAALRPELRRPPAAASPAASDQ
jgi:hypothetical protein